MRVGINGLGRIGRLAIRVLQNHPTMELVHVNDITGEASIHAHLLAFDSVHGRWGFDISGESLNPMLAKMIPSNVKNQGLLKVTQVAKYSPYWQGENGQMFEMNSFGSFKQINQSFE